MRFSAMTFSFGPGNLDNTCQAISHQNFDLIDLAAGPKHQIDILTAAMYPQEEAAWVRKILKTYQLGVSEVFLLHFGIPINQLNPRHKVMYRKMFNGFIEFCREIGAESIMMSPGKLNNEIGETASRQLAVEELRIQHEICSAKDLQLNIEPHWHSLAETPQSAQWFCEQVPGIGLTLDYSHFIAQGFTQEQVEPLHVFTNHFHARQAKTGATNASMTEGVIDFERVIRKFSTDMWDGVICLEYNPSLITDAPGEIRKLKSQLSSFMNPKPTTAVKLIQQNVTQWNRIVFDPNCCRTCKLCEMVCSITHEAESRPELSRINITFDAFKETDPIHGSVCAQCLDAPCIAVCPVDAMSRDRATGAVVIAQDLCIGCMACRRECPWDVPKKHPELGVAIKCDLCSEHEGGPICVEMCPLSGKALRYVQTQENMVSLEVV